MAHRSGAKGNGRNFGLKGGPGKGSADRTSDREAYKDNFDWVVFPRESGGPNRNAGEFPPGFIRRGNKYIKKYQ